MNAEFRPTRSLSFRAAIAVGRSMLALPVSSWIVLFSMTSGFALLANFLRVINDDSVQWWQWAGSLLFLPLLGVFCLIAAFLKYRFAAPVSIDGNGIRIGGIGRVLRFWQPVECSIKQSHTDSQVYLLSCCVENIIMNKEPLPMEGVSQDSDRGFFEEIAIRAGRES